MCIRDRIKGLEYAGAISNASLRAVSAFYDGQRETVRRRFQTTARIFPDHTARMQESLSERCLLYTSDAADERSSVDLGGRRIIKKKNQQEHMEQPNSK